MRRACARNRAQAPLRLQYAAFWCSRPRTPRLQWRPQSPAKSTEIKRSTYFANLSRPSSFKAAGASTAITILPHEGRGESARRFEGQSLQPLSALSMFSLASSPRIFSHELPQLLGPVDPVHYFSISSFNSRLALKLATAVK
mgnify:CR=1 FL=1